jgi:hypothetical protein
MHAVAPEVHHWQLARRASGAGLAALADLATLSGRARRPRNALNAGRPLYALASFPALSALACVALRPLLAGWSRFTARTRLAILDRGELLGHQLGHAQRQSREFRAYLGNREIALARPLAPLVGENSAERVGPAVTQRAGASRLRV